MGSKALIKSFITKHRSDFFVLSLSIGILYLNFSPILLLSLRHGGKDMLKSTVLFDVLSD